ncbi:hypothetical protein GQ54DRAFT_258394 [Martensiomyces pterosporus]|nr:hypothetical protein GQ54DRAFT_258394 [Martensiomyces pterosporus]
MINRVFFKVAGVPITQDAIPLVAVITSLVGFGIYTGVTRLRDPHYIRYSPTHSYKNN